MFEVDHRTAAASVSPYTAPAVPESNCEKFFLLNYEFLTFVEDLFFKRLGLHNCLNKLLLMSLNILSINVSKYKTCIMSLNILSMNVFK